MEDRDFETLVGKLTDAISGKPNNLTIGSASVWAIIASIVAFLVVGYFTNAGEIKVLKANDENLRGTVIDVKKAIEAQSVLLTEIRGDQKRREEKEKR